jgi:biotin transporter BioY
MLTHVAYPSDVISQKQSSWLQDLFLIGIGSVLISLCAPISIKLPFTPVPLALAPHLCLALGVMLGAIYAPLLKQSGITGMPSPRYLGLPVF